MDYKYLVRSKGRLLHCRDGAGAGDPVYRLTPQVGWVPFRNLPNGVGVGGDGDLDVKEIAVGDAVPEPPAPHVKAEHPALTKAKAENEAAKALAAGSAPAHEGGGAKGTMAGRRRKMRAQQAEGDEKEE